ncbi:MAG: class I SAM-dependent methyltransferase [Verrucomicrobiota bacterium]|nr:class I SAM-dependent methyltransferase [Verrucomicrobiota bacterium]
MSDEEKNRALPPYHSLVQMVEELYAEHGDNHRGLGYPKVEGFDLRYQVYLDVIRNAAAREKCTLLDIGCGTARLLDLIEASGRKEIVYRGIDLSPRLIEAARGKHPQADFLCGDPFETNEIWLARPDYVVFGGIFTCRLQMSVEEMTGYMIRLLGLAFNHCQRGLAFNVMSHHVDWQRDDLFHVPFDRMADILQANFGRHYHFRADYGLYEYTVYLYRSPILG